MSALATPLVIALLIAAVGVLCGAMGRRRTRSWLLAVAAVVAYLGSIVPVGDALLLPLERKYPPLRADAIPPIAYVVVLGSGYAPRNGIPITAAIDSDGLVRIAEAVRLARQVDHVRLIVSGGAPPGRSAPATGYAELARDFGIDSASLTILDGPLDTAAEASEVARLLVDTPFLLVTSAYHMPRAMHFMQLAGARPVPAPTGHRVNAGADWAWHNLLPTAGGLGKTERALHEYLGLLAAPSQRAVDRGDIAAAKAGNQ